MTLSLGKQLQAVISKMENDASCLVQHLWYRPFIVKRADKKQKKKILKVFYENDLRLKEYVSLFKTKQNLTAAN